jgi:DNA-directed RNA polymerase subunit RPC12/RpoP
MKMPGYGKLAGGVILIIVAALFIIFAAIAAITYFDGVPKVEDKKEIRDRMEELGYDTSSLDEEIENDEETLNSKIFSMGICSSIGIILIIIGIILIYLWNKEKKSLTLGYPVQYPAQRYPQHYQQQMAPTQRYPPAQMGVASFNCPHCGRESTIQTPRKDAVINCPFCGGRVIIQP